jgi:ribosomal-protein-alanine N-acetyltransferase
MSGGKKHGTDRPTSIRVDERILLRRWQPEDAEWYVRARDEETYRWTTESRTLTVDQAKAAIAKANDDPSSYCYAIIDERTASLLGNIALVTDTGPNGTGEIMYWLAPDARGQGVATMSLESLSAWAFRILKLRQVELRILEGNTASEQVAVRAGFHHREQPIQTHKQEGYRLFVRTRVGA